MMSSQQRVMERDPSVGTILIVDDEESVREALRWILEPKFRILSAPSGDQALEIVGHEPVDVITLDLRMPGLSGVETLAKIREISRDIEVVIVTATGSYEQVLDVMRLGVFDHVTKPFDADRILRTISRAERLRRALSEAPTVDSRAIAAEIQRSIEALADTYGWSLHEADRSQVDYVRLLAAAIHDGIYADPLPRVDTLIQRLGSLVSSAPSVPEVLPAIAAIEYRALALRKRLASADASS